MAVKIICDSTADVAQHLRERLTVVPLTIRFGEEEYIDGVTIDSRKFYEKLVESDVIPTTSQATPSAFAEVFQKIVDAGDQAVVITITSKMSGTCQSAFVAAADFPGSIYVVDSDNVTIGAGVLVEYAQRLADQGMDAAEIAERLEKNKNRVRIVALVDTLEYLKRGGRISSTAAFVGNMLSIKPVICVKDGEISVLGKARGSRQGNNLLTKQIEQAGGFDPEMPILLGYTGLSDAMLQKYMEDSRPIWEDKVASLSTTVIGSVVGTHAGPGAVGVAFFHN